MTHTQQQHVIIDNGKKPKQVVIIDNGSDIVYHVSALVICQIYIAASD